MTANRPLPFLIVGIIGWLFAPLLIYILGWKVDSLLQGTSTHPTWFVLVDMALMLAYLACIAGFWWMRRWSVDLYIAVTLAMAALHAYGGVFSLRTFALPLLVCVVGLIFRPRLRAG
ncbi:MAG: hypothetical protein ACPG4N_06490 [Gammaproteobacteria bacterium]